MLNSHNYNPDVLTCLANLSSDEVFTPPKLVNEILDLLPHKIWTDCLNCPKFPDCQEVALMLNLGEGEIG